MNLILAGINYKTAPIDIRERVNVSRKMLPDIFNRLSCFASPVRNNSTLSTKERNTKSSIWISNGVDIEGAVVLFTCNRTEIYASYNNIQQGFLIDFIIDYFDLCNSSRKYFYEITGLNAIKHLFRVASGLESQILGEPEILGQVKEAYFFAHNAGWTNKTINKIFLKAIETGKRVRTETKISQGNISYGSVILSIVKNFFDTIKNKNIILVGTGKMASIIVSYLKHKKANVTVVANKHFDIAIKLASEVKGKAIMFDEIDSALDTADVIISSTSAPHFILNKSDFEPRAGYQPLLIFDIAVPRDIDPEVRNIENIYLYDIDDLTAIIEKNIEMRKKEQIVAQRIIDEEITKFIEEAKCSKNYELVQGIAN
jgi:glutamyl-tRNA reductase